MRGCFLFNILEKLENTGDAVQLQRIEDKNKYKESKKQIEKKIKLLKIQKFYIKKYFGIEKPVILILNSLIMKEKEKKRDTQQNYMTNDFVQQHSLYDNDRKIRKILSVIDGYMKISL